MTLVHNNETHNGKFETTLSNWLNLRRLSHYMSNQNPSLLPSRQGIWSPPVNQHHAASLYQNILSKYLNCSRTNNRSRTKSPNGERFLCFFRFCPFKVLFISSPFFISIFFIPLSHTKPAYHAFSFLYLFFRPFFLYRPIFYVFLIIFFII